MTSIAACAVLTSIVSTTGTTPPPWLSGRRAVVPTQNWGQSGAVRPKGEWVGTVDFTTTPNATIKYAAEKPLREGTFGYQGVSAVIGDIYYSFPVGASGNFPFRSTIVSLVNLTSGEGRTVVIPRLIELGHIQAARYDAARGVLVLWGLTLPGEDHKPIPGDFRNLIADLDLTTLTWTLWPGTSGNFSGGACASEIGMLDFDSVTTTFYSGCSVLTGFNYVLGVRHGTGIVFKSGQVGAQYDLIRAVCAPAGGVPLLAVIHSFDPTTDPPTDGVDTLKMSTGGPFTSIHVLDGRFGAGWTCQPHPPAGNRGSSIAYIVENNTTNTNGQSLFALRFTTIYNNAVSYDAKAIPLELSRMQPRDLELYR